MVWGIPLVSWGVSCPVCALSQLLVHPQPTRREGPEAVQALLSNS